MLESRFLVEDLAALRALLGEMANDDRDLRCTYFLDGADVEALTAAFGVAFDPGGRDVALGTFCAEGVREAPYLVHTGYEFALMLEGRKPLALFWDTDPCDWLDELMGRLDPFVAGGRFVRRKVAVPMPKPRRAPDGRVVDRWQQVYVALRGEEWRVEAFILLRRAAERSGWNEALERFEGSLLGHEDWQNDRWLCRRRRVIRYAGAVERA